MSDCLHNTSSCFSDRDEASSSVSYTSEFRLLVLDIVHNSLNNAEIELLHLYLQLPKRLLDGSCLSVAVLRSLEERNFIKKWQENPNELKRILENVVGRFDLASKVDELSDKYSNVVTPPIQVVQQESTCDEEEHHSACASQCLPDPRLPQQDTFIPPVPNDPQAIADGIVTGDDTDTSTMQYFNSEQKVLLRRNRFRPFELETVPEERDKVVIISSRLNDSENDCIPVIDPQRDSGHCSEAVSPVHVENGTLLPEFLNNRQARENFGKIVIREIANNYNQFYITRNSSDGEHSCLKRSDSNASSGYGSHRGSDVRDSDARLSFSYGGSSAASLTLSSSYESSDLGLSGSCSFGEFDKSPSDMIVSESPKLSDRHDDIPEPRSSPHSLTMHPKMVNTVTAQHTQHTKYAANLSPPPTREHEVALNTTESPNDSPVHLAESLECTVDFRPRSSSLPIKAKGIRNQVCNKIRKGSTNSSSTSLDGGESGCTDAHLSSQMSILSQATDQSSSDSSTQSECGSQDSVNKANSLKREPTISRITIIGQIQVPLKKVFNHISKHKQKPFKSDQFPSFKDQNGLSYEFRFFPSNFSNDSCALYLDVSRDYLRQKAGISPKTPIQIPLMMVTASIHVSTMEIRDLKTLKLNTDSECIKRACESVPSSSQELPEVAVSSKQKVNYVTVTRFPQLVKHSDLERFREFPSRNLVIKVQLEY